MRIMLLSFFLSLQVIGHAQREFPPLHMPRSQFRFAVMPALYQKLDVQNTGAPFMQTPIGFGGEATISYAHQIWKGFGITLGVGYGLVPYAIHYQAAIGPGSVFENTVYDQGPGSFSSAPITDFNSIFTVPLTLEKRIKLDSEENIFLNLEAGIKWNGKASGISTTHGESSAILQVDGVDESITFLEYEHTNEIDFEFISYMFKAGLFHINRRSNSWQWNLVFQYTPYTMITGNYSFSNLGVESFGTLEQRNSYIGLEVVYGLTLNER